jgi:hypothetical protein
MNSKESLYCSTCSKEFKRKTCFDKHISICGVLNNKNNDYIPSNREIYILFIDLSKKYDLLEKKYINIQNKYNSITIKNKSTPMDFLKQNIKCEILLDDFINSINISRIYIDYIIKNNFIETICYIICDLVDKHNINCIQCFEEKKDIIYVFNNEWNILNGNLLKNMVSNIKQKIFIAFKSYIDENKEKLYEEAFSTCYTETMKKIMDENEKITGSIKHKLYASFKNKLNIS